MGQGLLRFFWTACKDVVSLKMKDKVVVRKASLFLILDSPVKSHVQEGLNERKIKGIPYFSITF